MSVLTTATGLTNKLAFSLNRFSNCFTISHLRFANISLYTKLTLHAVYKDV